MPSCTPAHIAAVRGPFRGSPSLQEQRQDERKATMNTVKQLYLDRRYKQCAALCEDALKSSVNVGILTYCHLHNSADDSRYTRSTTPSSISSLLFVTSLSA